MTHLCPHGRALVSCVPCRRYYTEQWAYQDKAAALTQEQVVVAAPVALWETV